MTLAPPTALPFCCPPIQQQAQVHFLPSTEEKMTEKNKGKAIYTEFQSIELLKCYAGRI
jgi:hypothetical protein